MEQKKLAFVLYHISKIFTKMGFKSMICWKWNLPKKVKVSKKRWVQIIPDVTLKSYTFSKPLDLSW